MSTLSEGLPRIIYVKKSFSCFLNAVHGTIEASVYDNGSETFPCTVTADTNFGGGSFSLDLSGNQSFDREVQGISIHVEITGWSCTTDNLSFHVKASAKKSILSCTVFDQTLNGSRHNEALLKERVAEAMAKVESAT